MTDPQAAPLAERRARYARDVMRWAEKAGIAQPRVESAFASVPREKYLTPPPWRVLGPSLSDEGETSDPAALYRDALVVLDEAKGINNGQPSLHAAWLSGIDPRPGERVVQIGIGCGYYTAILADLVGPDGRIDAYEIEPALAALATANLSGLEGVRVHAVSGVGATLPQADIVYVSAAAAAPDVAWLEALRPGGRLIFPWQPDRSGGSTTRVTRRPGGFAVRQHGSVSFVCCRGAQLADVRPQPGCHRTLNDTRSVWLRPTREPDGTATAVFERVWFSAEEV